jgi:hypothetical protein
MDEGIQRFGRVRLLLGHLANNAARFDAGLMQHQTHIAQRSLHDRMIDEQRRIEIDKDQGSWIEKGAGIEQVQRARQRLDREPVRRRDQPEEIIGRQRLAAAERPGKALEGSDPHLAAIEREKRLEGALQRESTPDADRRAVVLANDVGEADAARHACCSVGSGTGTIACKNLPLVNEWRSPQRRCGSAWLVAATFPSLRFRESFDNKARRPPGADLLSGE